MDSKLVVEQMSGRWKVKHPDLIALDREARGLASQFDRITFTWIPREQEQARRPPGQRGDGRRGRRNRGRRTVTSSRLRPTRRSRRRRAGRAPRGAPTRLLLLRHGQTELSVERRYSGRGNPPLTELGRRQADAAAAYLGGRGGIAAVVSSPLQRAYDTAQAAGKALGLDVVVDDDLIETDFGDWEGLTFTEAADTDPDLHRRWLRDTTVTPPGGESFDAVHNRVRRARARIITEYGGSTVLVVSHVTPIKTLLRMALDAGPGMLYRLHLDLASLSIAEFYPDGAASVRLVNQTAYL